MGSLKKKNSLIFYSIRIEYRRHHKETFLVDYFITKKPLCPFCWPLQKSTEMLCNVNPRARHCMRYSFRTDKEEPSMKMKRKNNYYNQIQKKKTADSQRLYRRQKRQWETDSQTETEKDVKRQALQQPRNDRTLYIDMIEEVVYRHDRGSHIWILHTEGKKISQRRIDQYRNKKYQSVKDDLLKIKSII